MVGSSKFQGELVTPRSQGRVHMLIKMWGAAVATGNGDVMMRFLPTYHAVELMRSGLSPEEAAKAAIKRITDKGYKFGGGLAVASVDGRHGGAKAGWEKVPFSYSVQTRSGAQKYKVT